MTGGSCASLCRPRHPCRVFRWTPTARPERSRGLAATACSLRMTRCSLSRGSTMKRRRPFLVFAAHGCTGHPHCLLGSRQSGSTYGDALHGSPASGSSDDASSGSLSGSSGGAGYYAGGSSGGTSSGGLSLAPPSGGDQRVACAADDPGGRHLQARRQYPLHPERRRAAWRSSTSPTSRARSSSPPSPRPAARARSTSRATPPTS